MCTAMSLVAKKNDIFFGRTMDFSFELDPEVYIIPRGYEWQSIASDIKVKNQYKFIGTGQEVGRLLFADGMNEKGLGVAALYFPGYAVYDSAVKGKKASIAQLEMVPYLLGNCASIEDVIKAIEPLQLIGTQDPITNTVTPLHWFVTDKKGRSLAIESTTDGIQIYDNPVDVLANSPGFPWHLTNLKNYTNLSPTQKEENKWGNLILTPFGQGAGAFGLPGDFTPPSRFVRVAFEKSFLEISESREETLLSCFRIMNTVSIPRGVVMTKRNTTDYTQYTVFMNLNTGDYYFNTYYNTEIKRANLNTHESTEVISLGKMKQQITIPTI
ncbi:MAG: choloylglycine hydrolase family protein [Bacilli bacterium]|nr:choloylglycine hydrolase family protein [Bacilli bacterium]